MHTLYVRTHVHHACMYAGRHKYIHTYIQAMHCMHSITLKWLLVFFRYSNALNVAFECQHLYTKEKHPFPEAECSSRNLQLGHFNADSN